MLNETNRAASAAPSQIRAEVLKQHEALRSVLDAAEAALQEGRENRLEVVHLAHEIRRRFRAHLAFEERVLVPVLSGVDIWGPDRVRDLVAEHTRQRAELDGLLERFEGEWDSEDMRRAFRSFRADFLRDMAEEERDYLGPGLLRNFVVIADAE
jgi:Hemerythrin HHE cation binding domain